jgi:DNA-binding winged helix-turn-helix (wHTH) protein
MIEKQDNRCYPSVPPGANRKMWAVFGPFCFDLNTLELTKNGIRLGLEEKPARALARLIERRGTLVSREELRSSLWDGAVNLDFNHGLNKAVNKLRTLLGDDANQPKYLETLSRRGYRFIAEVELILDPPAVDSGNSASPSIAASNGNGSLGNHRAVDVQRSDRSGVKIPRILRFYHARPRRHFLVLAAITVLAVAVAVVIGSSRWNGNEKQQSVRAVIKLPPNVHLMTASENLGLSISPDGTQIVFSAEGADGVPRLWLRHLDTLTPESIAGTEHGSFPFWSPDGKKLGFFTESYLKRVNLVEHSVVILCPVQSPRGGSWSRDDVILLAPNTRGPIYKMSANGGIPVPVTTLDEAHYTTHRWPVFLEDGTHFVFLAANHTESWSPGSMYVGSTTGGETKMTDLSS